MSVGRQPGFTMSNEHRDKIRNSNILRCLIDHAEGTREMSATQVTAGLGLLKKALPDLATVAIKNEEGEEFKMTVTKIALVAADDDSTD